MTSLTWWRHFSDPDKVREILTILPRSHPCLQHCPENRVSSVLVFQNQFWDFLGHFWRHSMVASVNFRGWAHFGRDQVLIFRFGLRCLRAVFRFDEDYEGFFFIWCFQRTVREANFYNNRTCGHVEYRNDRRGLASIKFSLKCTHCHLAFGHPPSSWNSTLNRESTVYRLVGRVSIKHYPLSCLAFWLVRTLLAPRNLKMKTFWQNVWVCCSRLLLFCLNLSSQQKTLVSLQLKLSDPPLPSRSAPN